MLKRYCQDLMELNSEEWVEFGKIVQKMEKSLNELFKPDLFNWSCFKNAAFRDKNPQPEIHWHFLPRYSEPVEYNGIIFNDPDFGYIPQPIHRKIPLEVRNELFKLLKFTMDNNEI